MNLALLEKDAKRPLEALKYARQYIAHPKSKPDKVKQTQDDLMPSLLAATARIDVDAEPGAKVTIDGKEVGKAPLEAPVDVLPGDHTVVAGELSKQVTLGGGDQKIVDLALKKTAPTRPPSASTAPAASTTAPAPTLTSSSPPPPATSSTPPTNDTGPDRGTVWTGARIGITSGLAVVGVAGLVVGFVESGSASSANDRIKNNNAQIGTGSCAGSSSPACSDLASAYSDHKSAVNGATAGFLIGGVGLTAAAATAVYWYVSPARVTVAPTGGQNGAGFLVMGSF